MTFCQEKSVRKFLHGNERGGDGVCGRGADWRVCLENAVRTCRGVVVWVFYFVWGADMRWDQKLRQLQDKLGVTAEELAGTLGITSRTLSDLMKSPDDGGREPTGPVQRLVDLLIGELDSQGVASLPQSRLNLVVIHEEFRTAVGREGTVDAILEMHAAAGTQRNNEFHYVIFEPSKDVKWVVEGLLRRRVQPHFFLGKSPFDTSETRDCYFTATTVWLVSQAIRRDLAHITLAADPRKYWPLARELKELAEVEVTFVRESGAVNIDDLDEFIKDMGIGIADSSGRQFGEVYSLKVKGADSKEISYGFISPGKMNESGEVIRTGNPLFFSWNHMRKSPGTANEMKISDLRTGDYVSYSIGMNNRGPCATDVALVKRAVLPNQSVQQSTGGVPRILQSDKEQAEIIEIITDAVNVCADEDGWALSADVGSRISVLHPTFKNRLQDIGAKGMNNFVAEHPAVFDYSQRGEGTRYSAACIRVKPTVGNK